MGVLIGAGGSSTQVRSAPKELVCSDDRRVEVSEWVQNKRLYTTFPNLPG